MFIKDFSHDSQKEKFNFICLAKREAGNARLIKSAGNEALVTAPNPDKTEISIL